jgi:hypothetical protein
MPRRVFHVTLAVALGAASRAAARQAPVVVHGVIVSAATAESLPHSIVALEPGFAARLSDARGRFTFTGVRPGIYRLVVRQIAHVRVDTTLVIGVAPDTVRISMRRVAIALAPVTVKGTVECRVPGPPDPAVSADAAAVFEQAVENARRYRLVADSFPHRSLVERTLVSVDAHGNQRVTKVDTLPRESSARRPYRPGRIVTDGAGPRLGELEVRMWSLEDFADSVFARHHCFRLAGRDTLGGEPFIRLDFQPPRSFGEADVEGAVYLDPSTYVVRHAVVRLTQPRHTLRNVALAQAHTRFRLIAPWLLVYDHRAVTLLRQPRGAQRLEEVRLLDVRFHRPVERLDPQEALDRR